MPKNRRKRFDKQRREWLNKLESASYLKREAFYALENAKLASLPFRIIGYFLFFLIVANAIVVFISADPNLDPFATDAVAVFYNISTACFFVEYLTRIWIADLAYEHLSPAKARLKYLFSGWGIIDFLSFFPSMLAWFVPMTGVLRNLINVVRLVRLFKISRYMRGLRTIGRVLTKRRSEIVASFLVLALLVFLASVAMYEIEHPVQPKAFDSLLSGLYWAVTTITATGYGDIVPITPLGRIVGSIIMFLSVALFAIPGGIFSAGFVAEFQNANRPQIKREEKEEELGEAPTDGESQSRL